ncbi:hypothetical protein NDU88_004781 [Pleurodeles waltl]|uniref:Uncharacterized protein n=1 Tax=Pleurodeles waltl TaxID=8319 RepID=A0AAV7T8S7_PLEWA|nr:hypothetical protein NDU88_004781 [Pleurodeles waltl]
MPENPLRVSGSAASAFKAELEKGGAASAVTPRPAPWSLYGPRRSRGDPRDLGVCLGVYRGPGVGRGKINVPRRGNLSPRPQRALRCNSMPPPRGPGFVREEPKKAAD